MSVDITGINKITLLFAMWQGMHPAKFFGGLDGPTFDRELAKEAVKSYIDYFCGRCIKTDLSKDTVDPWLYNRDAGAGAFEKIVEKLKK
jgi:hypothetical protein